jgi:hypothetical protein
LVSSAAGILNGIATVSAVPTATFQAQMSISGTVTISCIGIRLGDNWSNVAADSNTWTDVSAGGNTWTTVTADANTWTDVSTSGNSWTDTATSSDNWLRNG